MNLKRSEILAVCAALGMTVLATGCGSSSNPTVPTAPGGINQPLLPPGMPGATGCLSGTFFLGGYCVPGSSFQQACQTYPSYAGGGATAAYVATATPHCKITVNKQLVTQSILNPNKPYSATPTVVVRKNDKVKLLSANGYWGTNGSCDTWGPFGFCTYGGSCTSKRSFTTNVDYAGYRQAFLGAVSGTGESFELPLPTEAEYVITSENGTLYTGLNIPPNENYVCVSGSATLTVTRCEDATGNTLVCP